MHGEAVFQLCAEVAFNKSVVQDPNSTSSGGYFAFDYYEDSTGDSKYGKDQENRFSNAGEHPARGDLGDALGCTAAP